MKGAVHFFANSAVVAVHAEKQRDGKIESKTRKPNREV
jgi:hypothetical protein